jgi:hypothetical protein
MDRSEYMFLYTYLSMFYRAQTSFIQIRRAVQFTKRSHYFGSAHYATTVYEKVAYVCITFGLMFFLAA